MSVKDIIAAAESRALGSGAATTTALQKKASFTQRDSSGVTLRKKPSFNLGDKNSVRADGSSAERKLSALEQEDSGETNHSDKNLEHEKPASAVIDTSTTDTNAGKPLVTEVKLSAQSSENHSNGIIDVDSSEEDMSVKDIIAAAETRALANNVATKTMLQKKSSFTQRDVTVGAMQQQQPTSAYEESGDSEQAQEKSYEENQPALEDPTAVASKPTDDSVTDVKKPEAGSGENAVPTDAGVEKLGFSQIEHPAECSWKASCVVECNSSQLQDMLPADISSVSVFSLKDQLVSDEGITLSRMASFRLRSRRLCAIPVRMPTLTDEDEEVKDLHHVPEVSEKAKSKLKDNPAVNEKLQKKEEDCIGFATLPDQIHRKVVKRGFHFTVMVVGESGLGKSTLVNSLFTTDLYSDRKPSGVEEKFTRTVEITKSHLDIEERSVKLRMTIIDTPGFGDGLRGQQSYKPVEEYIDKQFLQYLQDESGLNRKNIQDNRVHCLLYFISPSSHGLKPLDIEVMKRLHHKVNIIPIIAKADTLTQPETWKIKQKVLSDLEKYGINIYDFPDCDSEEDEDFKKADAELKTAIPFAVVGSNIVLEANGRRVRGRVYPWGIVEVENPTHSDFLKLRRMLISTHLQDLKDVTDEVHYENFRAEYIQRMEANNNFILRALPESSGNQKLQSEPTLEQRLLEKELELKRTQEMLARMQSQLSLTQFV